MVNCSAIRALILHFAQQQRTTVRPDVPGNGPRDHPAAGDAVQFKLDSATLRLRTAALRFLYPRVFALSLCLRGGTFYTSARYLG
jgi:hypothetical protein